MLISLLILLLWLSVFSVLHSYVFYPLTVKIIGKRKKQNELVFDSDELPFVSIIIAAHNEEKVILQKLESTLKSSYPHEKFEVLIGADCCTDKTNEIVRNFAVQYKNVKLFEYHERRGKSLVVNDLVSKSKGEFLVLTDANVFFDDYTIFQLIKHFKNNQIGLIGGNIINTNLKKTGISIQEKNYLDIEKEIKYNEGKIWGTMMGAFGGCYSIRKALYRAVPKDYLMDDFYISMGVMEDGFKAIFEPEAVCYEDVSDKISEEFRRKVRISAGNWQNLFAYKHLLFKPHFGLVFSFLSHKILRWKTPFFILMALSISYYLGLNIKLYQQLFYFQLLLFVPLCFDLIFKSIGVSVKWFRYVTHFYSMNLALLLGFFKFLIGVKSNVWKPTERNQ